MFSAQAPSIEPLQSRFPGLIYQLDEAVNFVSKVIAAAHVD